MIIFNKSEVPKDLSFTLSPSAEGEVNKLTLSKYPVKNQSCKITRLNLKNTKLLSKKNREFLQNLGYQLYQHE